MLLFALLATLAGQTRLEAQAEARLEARARTASAGDSPGAQAAADAEVSPRLGISLTNGGGRISLGYAPILRLREPYAATRRWELNQREAFYATWSREGHARPWLSQSFYYGLIDMASLFGSFAQGTGESTGGNVPGIGTSPMGPVPVQTLPLLGQAKELALDVALGVSWPLSRLTSLETSAGFFYGGGVDTPSRIVLPEQFAARGLLRLDTQVSPVTTVSGQVAGLWTRFPRLSEFTTVDASLRLRRQLYISTFLELGGGAAVVAGYAGAQLDLSVAAAPVGDAVLRHQLAGGAHRANLEIAAHVSPFVDRFLATVYSRADANVSLVYLYLERVELSARGGVGRSLGSVTTADRGALGDVLTTYVEGRGSYIAPRYWRLDLTGVNSTVVIGNAPVNNWLVSLSLTVHAEGAI